MKVLEINKSDFKHNLDLIKQKINSESQGTKLYAVVKANGMGLGLIECSKFLIDNGIESLAVACTLEGIELRKSGIDKEILMLSPVIEEKELQLLILNDITLTIGSINEIEILKNVIKKVKKENEKFQKVKIHIKIDTGFGRYGFLYSDLEEILNIFKSIETDIEIEGMYTHFSKGKDKKWTNIQYERFCKVIEFLKDNGYNPAILHCTSSTSFFEYPNMRLNAVRIGSALQGRTINKNLGLIKIGKFKTKIVEIKNVPKGYNISYGNTYKTKRNSRLATIPVGYMDGLNKEVKRDNFKFSNNIIAVLMEIKKLFKDNRIEVKIKDKNYKIIGRLGMYHSIVDITGNDEIQVGDEVQLNITPLQTNDKIRREYI